MEDVSSVKEEVRRFFEEKFKDVPLRKSTLNGIPFAKLSPFEASRLEVPFLEVETWEVVRDFDMNKCLGPDG